MSPVDAQMANGAQTRNGLIEPVQRTRGPRTGSTNGRAVRLAVNARPALVHASVEHGRASPRGRVAGFRRCTRASTRRTRLALQEQTSRTGALVFAGYVWADAVAATTSHRKSAQPLRPTGPLERTANTRSSDRVNRRRLEMLRSRALPLPRRTARGISGERRSPPSMAAAGRSQCHHPRKRAAAEHVGTPLRGAITSCRGVRIGRVTRQHTTSATRSRAPLGRECNSRNRWRRCSR